MAADTPQRMAAHGAHPQCPVICVRHVPQAYHAGGAFRRALVLLRAVQLVDESLEGRLLAAQCLERIGDHQECLNVLGGWNDAEVQLGAQVRRCRCQPPQRSCCETDVGPPGRYALAAGWQGGVPRGWRAGGGKAAGG